MLVDHETGKATRLWHEPSPAQDKAGVRAVRVRRLRRLRKLPNLEKLPFTPPRIDKVEPLEPPTQQVAGLPGGLYGDEGARRDSERRRAANKVLEDYGIRPKKRW